MSKLKVFGNIVKPNRYYQVLKVINGSYCHRKMEIVSEVMKGAELFMTYESNVGQKRYEVHRVRCKVKD